jgi:hypothetical protein
MGRGRDMRKTLACVVAVAFAFALVAFGSGTAPQQVAAGGGTDSPVIYVWCDYDGPDAVITPYGTMPASHTHFLGDGSVIELAQEGDYVCGPDGNRTKLVPTEEQLPDWVHFVDATEQIPDWIHVVYTANP